MKFKNKVVVITGAASGIGYATAKLFAQEGAQLALLGRNESRLEKAKQDLPKDRCLTLKTDVSDADQVNQSFATIIKTYKRIDILINCAGIVKNVPFWEMRTEDWDDMIAIHLRGTFLCSRAVVESMISQGSGVIINIGSTSGITGGTSGAHYAAAKGGIIAFTRAIARELAPHGIRVNGVIPSKIETPMLQGLTPEQREALIKKIPLGRTGNPQEIAEVISFLASDSSSYIIGETITASGGYP
jgi:NAD(P)-dependent dehydrogenase (short-subunit alcohol dehydrogenase family)